MAYVQCIYKCASVEYAFGRAISLDYFIERDVKGYACATPLSDYNDFRKVLSWGYHVSLRPRLIECELSRGLALRASPCRERSYQRETWHKSLQRKTDVSIKATRRGNCTRRRGGRHTGHLVY